MSNKTYWRYLWKRGIPLSSVVLGFELILAIVLIIANNSSGHAYDVDTSYRSLTQGYLISGYIVAMVIPLFSRAKYCSRRGSDLYLSLPFNRKKSYLFSSLFGFLQLYIPFLISFFLSSSLMIDQESMAHLDFRVVMVIFGMSTMAIVSGYALSLGVVSYANNLLDGFLYLIAAAGLPYLFALLFFFYKNVGFANPNYVSPSTTYQPSYNEALPLFDPVESFVDFTTRYFAKQTNRPTILPFFVPLLHLLFSSLFALLGYFRFLSWKAEESGGISQSLLPRILSLDALFGLAFASCGALFFTSPSSYYLIVILDLVLAFLYLVFYFIGKRKIAFSWSLVFHALSTFASGALLGAIIYLTSK